MPWKTSDVAGFTKAAKTDEQKAQWVAVANSVLAKCMEDGGTEEDCAPKAVT